MVFAWFSSATRLVAPLLLALSLAACGSGGDLGPDPSVPATITVQPASVTAADGGTASFTVAATGEALNFQWQRNGSNIAGATLAAYTTAALTLADTGAVYTVLISNTRSSVTSNPATLTVVPSAPRIATQPADTSVLDGDSATFTVVLNGGTPPITYQWLRNDVVIGGATAASYTAPSVAMGDTGALYRVSMTGGGGTTQSANARLTVTPRPPTVTDQPDNLAVTFQSSAAFAAQASGTAPLTYQWLRNGVALSGETSPSLSAPVVNYGDDGARYSVVVSNGGGQVESQAAVLTVNAPAGTVQALNSCITIGAPGAYVLAANIPTINVAGSSCITINASNVQLDCAGFSFGNTGSNATALTLGPVQNVSVKGCTMQTNRLSFDRVTNVSVHNNTFIATAGGTLVEAFRATLLAFDNNTLDLGSFTQSYGRSVTVSNNRISAPGGNSSQPAIIGSTYGTGTRVLNNTLNGRWGSNRGSNIQVGAQSGIDIGDESDVVIGGNTLTDIFTCGVELSGNISSLLARDNRVENAGQCGMIGSISLSLSSSRFVGNTINRSAVAFHFFRTGGLRPAGFDQPDRTLPADTAVVFRDVTIERNTLSNAIASDGGTTPPTVVILPITTRMNYDDVVAPGETLPGPGAFQLGNVRFVNNTFDRSASPIEFGQGTFTSGLIVDGGGNVCPASSAAGFPIVCR